MGEPRFPPGAVQALMEQAYKGQSRYTIVAQSVGTGAGSVAGANPERVQLTLVNLATVDVYIAPLAQVSSALGIPLAAGGGSVAITAPEDGPLSSLEWYAIAGAAASTVLVIEIIRDTLEVSL